MRRHKGFLKWFLSTLWMNQIYKMNHKIIQNWPSIRTHLLHLTTPPVDPPFLERPRNIIQPTTFVPGGVRCHQGQTNPLHVARWWDQPEPTGRWWFWSNYSDLTRPGPPNGGLLREFPLFQGNLAWWNMIPFGHQWLVMLQKGWFFWLARKPLGMRVHQINLYRLVYWGWSMNPHSLRVGPASFFLGGTRQDFFSLKEETYL